MTAAVEPVAALLSGALVAALGDRAARVAVPAALLAAAVLAWMHGCGQLAVRGYAVLLAAASMLYMLPIRVSRYTGPLVLVSAAGGLVVAASTSLLGVFAGVEAASLAVAGLYTVAGRGGREAGLVAVYVSLTATPLLVLAAAVQCGGGLAWVSCLLAFLGLAVEAGLAPFHVWLPVVAEKGGVEGVVAYVLLEHPAVLFALIRLLSQPSSWAAVPVALVFGVLSIGVGSLSSLGEPGRLRALGCVMVVENGVIMLLSAVHGGLSEWTAVLYTVASSLSIGLLYVTHWSGVAGAVAAASLAGLPPLPGFTAKLAALKELTAAAPLLAAPMLVGGAAVAVYALAGLAAGWTSRPRRELLVFAPYTAAMLALAVAPEALLSPA